MSDIKELKDEELEKVAGGSEELDYAVNYMLGHLSIAAGSTNDKEILGQIEKIKGYISDIVLEKLIILRQ